MANIGVFDVIGPIMIGPSSSHTAGAAKLGKIVKAIVNKPIKEVKFLLHGSFRETYQGHGTDRALVAGLLGMEPDDSRLKDSLHIAKQKNLKFEFIPSDLGQVHPNSVKFSITTTDNTNWEIIGSSIGGGLIEIREINGNKVQISGEYPTLITCHNDAPGTVAKVSSLFYKYEINIAFMNLARSQRGIDATMTFESDHTLPSAMIENIKRIEGINQVIVINPSGGFKNENC